MLILEKNRTLEAASVSIYRDWCWIPKDRLGIFSVHTFKVILDESYTADFFVMAGFVASVTQWESVDRMWNALLLNFDLPKAHHFDYVSKQGSYEGWDEKKRQCYIESVVSVIKASHLHGIAVSIDVNALNKTSENFGMSFSTYSTAAALAAMEFRDCFNNETAELRFDRVSDGKKHLRAAEQILDRDPRYCDWWREERVSWRHITKPEGVEGGGIRGIEIADFAAWEMRRYAEGGSHGSHWSGHRQPLILLSSVVPINGRIYSQNEFEQLFARLNPPNEQEN